MPTPTPPRQAGKLCPSAGLLTIGSAVTDTRWSLATPVIDERALEGRLVAGSDASRWGRAARF